MLDVYKRQDPSEEPDLFDDGELEDYSSYEETEAVGSELTYRRRVNWIQTILTGAMELLLVVLGVMALIMRRPPMEAHLYVTVNLFFLFVMALINHRLVGEGIASLFRLRADADSGAAAAVMITLIHTALQYFHIDAVAAGTTPVSYTHLPRRDIRCWASGRRCWPVCWRARSPACCRPRWASSLSWPAS